MTDEKFNEIFPFEIPRKNQRKIIETIIEQYESGKTNVCLVAPCGSGKSVIASAVANYFNTGYFLTSQKSLQNQYNDELNMPTIYGRATYRCNANKKNNCKQCMGTKTCKIALMSTDGCAYLRARNNGYFNSSLTVLNYSYALNVIETHVNYNGSFRRLQAARELVVCDEAHLLESEIINYSTLSFTNYDINRYKLGGVFSIPKTHVSDLEKLRWLFEVILPKAEEEFNNTEAELAGINASENQTEFKYLTTLKEYYSNMVEKINILADEFEEAHHNVVILQTNNESIDFKLLFGKRLFKETLQKAGKRMLYMSATMPSKTQFCKNLGLDPTDTSYIKVPSLFPIKNSPIVYMPVGKMTYNEKHKTYPKLIKKVEKILDKYQDCGGICHTGSYEVSNKIIENINTNRFLIPKGAKRQEILNMYFKLNENGNNKVLLSPSLHAGINLEGDNLGKFGITCKLPYPNLQDAWVKTRMKYDETWYNEATALNLIQGFGRIVRSETDFGINFILDESFAMFYKFNKKLFPKHIQNSIIIKK